MLLFFMIQPFEVTCAAQFGFTQKRLQESVSVLKGCFCFCRLLRLCAEAFRPCCSSQVWCGHDSARLQLRRHGCVSFRRIVCCRPWQRCGFCCSAPSQNRFGPLLASSSRAPEPGGRRWWAPYTLFQAVECLTRCQALLPMRHCRCRLPHASLN